jgi:hypothetical protein
MSQEDFINLIPAFGGASGILSLVYVALKILPEIKSQFNDFSLHDCKRKILHYISKPILSKEEKVYLFECCLRYKSCKGNGYIASAIKNFNSRLHSAVYEDGPTDFNYIWDNLNENG